MLPPSSGMGARDGGVADLGPAENFGEPFQIVHPGLRKPGAVLEAEYNIYVRSETGAALPAQ